MARRQATGPSSRKVLDDLRQALAGKGWPSGMTVLHGDDLYHLDAAQAALLEHLVPAEATDFALTVYGAEKVDLSTVVSAARSVGMFASSRVVLVRDIAMLDGDPAAIETYAAEAPRNSYLIVRAPELDRRRKLHKALEKSGTMLRFVAPSPDSRQLLDDVKSLAAERGLTMDPRAAAFLAEVSGADLYRVAGELDKLAAYLQAAGGGSKKKVGLEVVREVVSGGSLLSGWEVADAVLERDRGAALAAVARLVESGDEPIRIVGGLAWRARVMLQAKAMLDAGAGAQQVITATRAWAYRDRLLQGLKRYELSELLGFPSLLLEADRTLKSRALRPRAVLEHLVDRML